MLGLLKRLFDANDKEVKKVMKTVEKINKLEPTVAPLEDAFPLHLIGSHRDIPAIVALHSLAAHSPA